MKFVTNFKDEFKKVKNEHKEQIKELKFWRRINDNLQYAYCDNTLAFQITVSIEQWKYCTDSDLLERYANIYNYTVYQTRVFKDDCVLIAFVTIKRDEDES